MHSPFKGNVCISKNKNLDDVMLPDIGDLPTQQTGQTVDNPVVLL